MDGKVKHRQELDDTGVGGGVTDKRKAPAALARAMLRSERTLTERVAALERDMVAVKRRVAALEQARGKE